MSGQMQLLFDDLLKRKRGRPKKLRIINYTPTLTIREPTDGTKDDSIVKLGHDEFEALRLKNINGLGIIKAAEQMGISKSLFAKIHNEGLKKLMNGLLHGRSVHIEVGMTGTSDFIEKIKD